MKTIKDRIFTANILGLGMFGLYFFGMNGWAKQNDIIEESLFFIGTILVALGIIGRAWCFAYIAGNKDEELVQAGPYSLCRNPLYLFSFLAVMGVGFCSETFIVPSVILIYFLTQYFYTINNEERYLRAKFPADYDRYSANVPRIIPSFHAFYELERAVISPVAFRRGLFDLMFFIVAIGFFELIELVHKHGFLPTYYIIY